MTAGMLIIFFCFSREQIAELTRLGQTLMHVQRLFWIVADDSESCNPLLDKILDNFGE
jgi:beta-1,3-glucuronyltransferase S